GARRRELRGWGGGGGIGAMGRLPADVATMVSTNWLGPRGHLLHYPIRGGELMNFLSMVERDDWQVESWTVQGTTSELANDFSGWHADVQTIISNLDTPYKSALMVHPPI